jgi:hypothetical protein
MDKALEILELRLDPEHKQFGKLLSIQASMTGSILTATARVRAGDLRGMDDDGVDGLLAELDAAEGEPDVSEDDLFA